MYCAQVLLTKSQTQLI